MHEGPILGEEVCVTHQVSLPWILMAGAADVPRALQVRAESGVFTALVSRLGEGGLGVKGRENQVLRGRGSKKQKRNNFSVTNKFYLFSPFFKKEKEKERLEKEKELRED